MQEKLCTILLIKIVFRRNCIEKFRRGNINRFVNFALFCKIFYIFICRWKRDNFSNRITHTAFFLADSQAIHQPTKTVTTDLLVYCHIYVRSTEGNLISKYYSAHHCLVLIIEKIKKIQDQKVIFVVISTDLSKAFHCIA